MNGTPLFVQRQIGDDTRRRSRRAKDISGSQVAAIKALRDSAMSQKDIALQTGCSQSAVSKILAKEQSNKKNCGRKMKTTRRDERILKITTQNRFLSSNLICQLVPRFPSSPLRRLQSFGFGYYTRVPLTKPLLNSKQQKKHLDWARAHHGWTLE